MSMKTPPPRAGAHFDAICQTYRASLHAMPVNAGCQ